MSCGAALKVYAAVLVSELGSIARRTGKVRKAIRSGEPPSYRQGPVASKLDPHRDQVSRLLQGVEVIINTRIRELISEAGYEGSKTILDDYLRGCVRSSARNAPTSARSTVPLSFCSSTCSSLRRRFRSAAARLAAAGWSPASSATRAPPLAPPVFSKTLRDLLWGMNRCLQALVACPRRSSGTVRGRSTRARASLLRTSPPSAISSRSAGGSSGPETPSPRELSSAPTASCARTSNRRAAFANRLDYQSPARSRVFRAR